MKINVRHREKLIIDFVKVNEVATVSDLSEAFGVSDVTIRRDLARLAEKRIITRFHGGARLRTPLSSELAVAEFKQKAEVMLEEKRRIGRSASKLISDGDIVFINSGTSVLQFLTQIENEQVTIITNNVAALECTVSNGVSIMVLGGTYNHRTRSLHGEITINNLSNIYSTCTILGVNSLDISEGMTTSSFPECAINSAMIKNTKGKVILLADSTKIGRISSYVSSPLSKIDVIITDDQCPKSFIQKAQEKGVEVIVV